MKNFPFKNYTQLLTRGHELYPLSGREMVEICTLFQT